MKCPVCGEDTKVQSCRSDCESVVRRRKCDYCNYIFYTEEIETDSASKEFNRIDKEYRFELKMKKIRRLLDND